LFAETGKFDKILKRSRADIKEYSGRHQVELCWDLNQDAIRDKVFKMIINDDIELYLDLEEFLAYTRAI
jgi:hypothetical protein